MPSFTTRVELHGATERDYEILHAATQTEGFSRMIKSDSGIWYHLPTAEYDRSGQLTRAQVPASAKRAASKTNKSFAVLVTESNGRTWEGLKQVLKWQRPNLFPSSFNLAPQRPATVAPLHT
jgi:hypothetical protein